MHISTRYLLGGLSLLSAVFTPLVSAQNTSVEGWPIHDNGLNSVVEWDHYSILVNGKRFFVFAGEWHYWRIPVPEMWVDVMQKIKAAGFTGFAFYSHWGYHAPNSTTLDFETGAHNFTSLYTIARELGLYIIIRPGPYVNAEANAGGFPLWLTTGAYGTTLRNNGSAYSAAWMPYMNEHARLSSDYLVTKGENGLVYQVENELGGQWRGSPTLRVPNPTATAYMELLEDAVRANGIDVPLTQNQPNMNSYSWSEDWAPGAGGNVDIDGVDSYPSCWTCDLSVCTGTNGAYVAYAVQNYYNYFQTFQPTQPKFLPEFQGGSFNPWGGPAGGCPGDIGADFANLFYRHNIAEGVTAMSLYMVYGGTNWGSLAAPVVATSYDYSAPVSEDRSIGAKYYETKLLALFTRVAHDLTVTDRIANTNNASRNTNPNVLITELRNPITNAAFYVGIHNTSSSGTLEYFQLHVNTSIGSLTIPQKGGSIALNGHQSKIIVTDFTFGASKLIYSTAEVLTYSIVDGRPVLVLWVPTGETAELAIADAANATLTRCQGCSNVSISKQNGATIISLTQGVGMTVVTLNNGVKILVMDRTFAYMTWVPTLTNDPFAPENETLIVHGPYLVRGASISGNIAGILGDLAGPTTIEVFAPATITQLTWNDKIVPAQRSTYGSLIASLNGLTETPAIPSLPNAVWKYKGSLPEHTQHYDDDGPAWKVASHTTTFNPTKPLTLPILYMDDYAFHNGHALYRGYFTGLALAINLTVQGGTAFGYSVYLNGDHIGSFYGSTALEVGTGVYSFKNATYNLPSSGKPNVIFVIMDNNGHDETTGALNPRGILGASLVTPTNATLPFTTWKIAGTAGGEANIDPVRGALAEGGLHAERLGWHLPGFNDKAWATAKADATSNATSLSFKGAGVRFFRTVVPLDIPRGMDVSIAFNLNALGPQTVRVLLFVNGYQYGKFNPYIGHQTSFPVPPGILDYTGDNTIGLAVWAQTKAGAEIQVDWSIQYAVESSFDNNFDGAYLRPGWDESRRRWA